MNKALQKIVIPVLRDMGFKGSLPHFRRFSETKVDLLSFQFDKWGGGYVIEISTCSLEGVEAHWGEHLPATKATPFYMHSNDRLRIQARDGSGTEVWFRYDKKRALFNSNIYEKVAKETLPFIINQAEKWWSSKNIA